VISKLLVAFAFIFATCAPVYAQAGDIGTGVVLEHEGQRGIWLPLESHRLVLADLKALAETRTRVRLLEDKLVLREQQAVDLRAAADASEGMAKAATATLSASERRVREVEAERDAWHRAPLLWLGVGLVGGLGLALVAAKLAQAD